MKYAVLKPNGSYRFFRKLKDAKVFALSIGSVAEKTTDTILAKDANIGRDGYVY